MSGRRQDHGPEDSKGGPCLTTKTASRCRCSELSRRRFPDRSRRLSFFGNLVANVFLPQNSELSFKLSKNSRP